MVLVVVNGVLVGVKAPVETSDLVLAVVGVDPGVGTGVVPGSAVVSNEGEEWTVVSAPIRDVVTEEAAEEVDLEGVVVNVDELSLDTILLVVGTGVLVV